MYRKSPSKIWRKRKNRYKLIGSKSIKTNKTYYPSILIENYRNRLNDKFKDILMPQRAKLVTWSVVRSAPDGFSSFAPYIVAILEFDNKERITSQIVDVSPDDLKKGDIFYPTFRKIFVDGKAGIIHYGIKWTKY